MKLTPLLLLAILPLALVAGEVKIGDSGDDVRSELGAPSGQIHWGNREVLSFARGEVELASGVVTRVALRSDDEQTGFEAKRSADISRVRENEAIRRVQRTAEGETLKASKLADANFQSAPLRFQVEFWRNFASHYPNVSCTEQLSLARALYYEQQHAEQLAAEEAQRLAEIKARDSEQRMFYPIDSYNYDRHYSEARRQERLDREYYERVRSSHPERIAASCRDDRLKPVVPDRNNPPASSHTAMAFAGQNWLGWPTAAEIDQLKARDQTDSRLRIR